MSTIELNDNNRESLPLCNKQQSIPENVFNNLVKSSHYLIWQTDIDGKFTYLNPAWEKTFGFPLQQMLGRRLADFQCREFAKRDELLFSSLLFGETFNGYETECLSSSGSQIYLLIDASPIFNAANGKCIGTQGIAFNLTERKKIEKTVRKSESLLLQSQQVASVGYYIFDIWTGSWTNSPMLDVVFGIERYITKHWNHGWI
jgi:PAS domain S-box-containing protein